MSFDINAKFDLDGSGFEKGLTSLEQKTSASAERMKNTMATAFSGNPVGGLLSKLGGGGTVFAAAVAFAEKMASEVQSRFKEINLGKTLLQVDPQTFQRIQNVTERGGSSTEAVAQGFEHIAEAQEAIKNHEEGAVKAVEQFEKLGVSLRDLKTLTPQEVFFQIAAALKSGVVSGEQLAAVKERLGKSGPGLLPSFAIGFDSAAAARGNLTPEQIQELEKVKKLSAEIGNEWKGTSNAMAVFFSKLLVGVKAAALLPVILAGRSTAADIKQREAQRESAAGAAEDKKAADEQFAAKERADYMAQQDADLADKRHKREQDEAGKEAERLETENAKRQSEVKFDALSKKGKEDSLRANIAKEKALSDEFNQRFLSGGGADETLHRESAGHRALQLEAERKLSGLTTQHGENPFHIEDSLARIGGGFSDTNNTRPLLERTARGIETLVQQGNSNPDANPLKGA